MPTGSILSILVYPQSGYLWVYHRGLSLVHCSYLSIGSLHKGLLYVEIVSVIEEFAKVSVGKGQGKLGDVAAFVATSLLFNHFHTKKRRTILRL